MILLKLLLFMIYGLFNLKQTIYWLSLCYCKHTTNNIAGYVKRTIDEYKIEKFIFSITFDNASADNSAIEILIMQLEPIFFGNFFMFDVYVIF